MLTSSPSAATPFWRFGSWLGSSRLPLATLFQGPTVAELAAAVVAGPWPGRLPTSIVAIQAGGSRRPFFCVHPGGGHVFCYSDLSRHLGVDQPFYGLQSSSPTELDGEDADTLRRMAKRYVVDLRRVQPVGPYCLGGWSMGGVVAFEMARQIRAAGDAVAFLALIDSAVPRSTIPGRRDSLIRLLDPFARGLGWAPLLPLATSDLSPRSDSFESLGAGLRRLAQQADAAGLLPPDLDLPRLQELFRLFARNVEAMQRYVPEPYSGALTLFRAQKDAAKDAAGRDYGWRRWALAGVEVCSVPGDHFSMVFEPQVGRLAEQLRSRLSEAAER